MKFLSVWLIKIGILSIESFLAEAIAKEYAPKDNSKVIALKKLDAKAKMPATVFTYTFGIASSLVLGVGMCLCMGVLGASTPLMMALGIVIGCIGIAGVSVNYPLYKKILLNNETN